jgi:hypothetical protein
VTKSQRDTGQALLKADGNQVITLFKYHSPKQENGLIEEIQINLVKLLKTKVKTKS